MICYFDTSAFVPLLIPEPVSPACRRLWEDADDVVTTRLLYVEAAAALARAVRCHRITHAREAEALEDLDRYWGELFVIDPTQPVVRRAGELASAQALRGSDAVHCATAEAVDAQDLIFASGDQKQLEAGVKLGFYIADVNDPERSA
ncbi:PIN domain-containing protein [Kribbella capetownensis]|uniref:Ribonuclease VapC n=1 Tax=Kribbella capetownensis TaxID=1572659 RepID=A0A4R0K2K3_9ACTN|nr:type II toxin-antitoxin system VapC family toxin [Kribbella capetownensis]TCC52904.1 PIN domain-containing protein [Kribbella capetownensis]